MMNAGYDALDRALDAHVEAGRLVGCSVLIERAGTIVHEHHRGVQDRASPRPWDGDTIVRIFSMTKPITSAAILQLVERGRLRLDDRLDRFVPAFASMDVTTVDGNFDRLVQPILIRHLLTHTSGLTYDLYAPTGHDLAEVCEQWAEVPLAFQPGSGWCYGVSTDVLGRVVELVSGQPLDEYFAEHLLGPLGMVDTGFAVPDLKSDRIAGLYTLDVDAGRAVPALDDRNPPEGRAYLSGGGGLWGTARDYARWCRMLLNGGELDGTRVLTTPTITMMTANRLPGGSDIYSLCRPRDAVAELRGRGFGFGFAVEMPGGGNRFDPRPPTASFDWGGAASTVFWCDPANDQAVVFVTQLIPDTMPIRTELVGLIYPQD